MAAGSIRWCSASSASSSSPAAGFRVAHERPQALVLAGVVRVQELHQPHHVLAERPPLPTLRVRLRHHHFPCAKQVAAQGAVHDPHHPRVRGIRRSHPPNRGSRTRRVRHPAHDGARLAHGRRVALSCLPPPSRPVTRRCPHRRALVRGGLSGVRPPAAYADRRPRTEANETRTETTATTGSGASPPAVRRTVCRCSCSRTAASGPERQTFDSPKSHQRRELLLRPWSSQSCTGTWRTCLTRPTPGSQAQGPFPLVRAARGRGREGERDQRDRADPVGGAATPLDRPPTTSGRPSTCTCSAMASQASSKTGARGGERRPATR